MEQLIAGLERPRASSGSGPRAGRRSNGASLTQTGNIGQRASVIFNWRPRAVGTETWLMFERMMELLGRPLFKLGVTEVTPMRVATVILIVRAELWIRRLASTRGNAMSTATACMLGRMVRYVLLVVGMLVVLSAAGFDVTILALLGGAAGIGIGLGLQSLFLNFVSGIVLLLERGLKVASI